MALAHQNMWFRKRKNEWLSALIPGWPRGHLWYGAAAVLQSVTKDGFSTQRACLLGVKEMQTNKKKAKYLLPFFLLSVIPELKIKRMLR